MKPIDIVVLKKLSDVVNVVPVIAKSDSLTLEERAAFKERIKEEFAFHNLKMFPYENDEFDEEEKALNAQIKVKLTIFSPQASKHANSIRISFHLPLLGLRRILLLEANQFEDVKTDGVLSMLRTKTIANSSTYETSSPEPISKISSKPHLKSITKPSVLSNCWPSRRAVLQDMLVADQSVQQLIEN